MSDLSKFELGVFGHCYVVSKQDLWSEAYELFSELENEGKREFYSRNTKTTYKVFDEMMESVRKALAEDCKPDTTIEETTNAFIYSANSDPDFSEFKTASRKVFEGEKTWEYYASGSV